MTITWGSMKPRGTDVADVLRDNAAIERECLEQAKRELGALAPDGISLIRQVLARAQQIKQEKRG
jgi:hypothetical protein